MSLRPGLGATYRLQLTPAFGFLEAAARAGYLAGLGVQTLYCSPVAESVPGSLHGYDGTDPTRLRGELGGAAGFEALATACEAAGLGLCLDLVPNHLAAWPGGSWWRRLLAGGPDSEMGEVFDIDWDAPGAGRKVLLPLLDRPLAQLLATGGLRLGERPAPDGAPQPVLLLGEHLDLPISGGRPRAGEDLEEVLAAQHYRLVDWHDRNRRNYRRFFDIDGLVGVRVEVPEVFAATHALVGALARQGRCSALRVDHLDGLREPEAYLRRLAEATGLPIVVEKILTGDEPLRRSWPVAGTTGYEVLDDLGGALVDPEGQARLVIAARAEGEAPVAPLTVGCRRLVADRSFPAELARAAAALGVAQASLREALAHLPCYRTYLDPAGDPAEALDEAIWRSVEGPGGRDLVVDALLHPAGRHLALAVQQLSGAVMAKGVEDTAWYRLAGPLAFCEVGGDPARDRSGALERLHRRAAARAADGRAGLVPGTTHDTKRSADVRARLYALSELEGPFERGLAAFREALGLGPGGGELARESRVLAQLLLGVLPPLTEEATEAGPEAAPGDAAWPGEEALAERACAAVTKGAREAKERSSWEAPDQAYEATLAALARRALAEGASRLRDAFGELVDEVARLGAVNSLAQVLLRSALPGVPDCYQGDEVWNLSLVDPDNRRPVDYRALATALGQVAGAGGGPVQAGELRRAWRDGRVKLLVTARCLAARRDAPGALAPGASYQPLEGQGPAAASLVAFARRGPDGSRVLAVATRLASRLPAPPQDLPAGPSYAGTSLPVPGELGDRFLEVLSGREVAAGTGGLPLEELLAELPVALLVGLPRT